MSTRCGWVDKASSAAAGSMREKSGLVDAVPWPTMALHLLVRRRQILRKDFAAWTGTASQSGIAVAKTAQPLLQRAYDQTSLYSDKP